MLRRYVFGPGIDQPIVQYEGSGTTDRRFMGSDERGSIISLTDGSGTVLTINRYDEYGKPQTTNSGRFQYTGQKWLSEANLYDYKARDYLPHLGIFAQRDPIGGTNLYAYVGNNPVNAVDPFGLQQCLDNCGPVDVWAYRLAQLFGAGGGGGGGGGFDLGAFFRDLDDALAKGQARDECDTPNACITITAKRLVRPVFRGLWKDFVRGVRTSCAVRLQHR